MRPLRFMPILLLLTLTVGLSGLFAPADAFWPFDRWFSDGPSESAVVAPPAVDAIKTECGPIQRKIQELNQTNRVARSFVRPRIGLLKKEYHDCVYRINQQEYEYLKRAEIKLPEEVENVKKAQPVPQQPVPDLPPLQTDEDTSSEN